MSEDRDRQPSGTNGITRDEACEILDALSAEHEAGDDPRIREAVRMVQSDPELAARWERRRREDGTISGLLRQVEAPEELRKRLRTLTGKRPGRRKSSRILSQWIGWCAAAAVLFAVAWAGFSRLAKGTTVEDFRIAMVETLRSIDDSAVQEEDLKKVVKWLHTQEAPVASNVLEALGALDALHGMGCKILDWRGNRVSLICFQDGKGETWHLLTIPTSVFERLPQDELDKFLIVDHRETKGWVDHDMFQLLVAGTDSN